MQFTEDGKTNIIPKDVHLFMTTLRSELKDKYFNSIIGINLDTNWQLLELICNKELSEKLKELIQLIHKVDAPTKYEITFRY